MNEITGVHKVSTIGPIEDENGNIINSIKEKCERMNNYFANVGKLRKKPRKLKIITAYYRVTPIIDTINYHPDKLLKCYKQVFKPGKAGHDGITSKEALLISKEILTELY